MTIVDTDAGSETVDDLHNGNWADLTLQLSSDFDAVMEPMVDQILATENLARNQTNLRNHKSALSFLLSNLLQLHFMDASAFCLVSRNNGCYRSSPYNPFRIGGRALRRCFSYLRNNGFIEVRGGNYNHSGEGAPGGMVTRCRALGSLLRATSPQAPRDNAIGEYSTPGITRNTNYFNDINSIRYLEVFNKSPVPIIRMKNEDRVLIETPDHSDLHQMIHNLERINSYLEDHWIDLCIPDEELPQALTNQSLDENSLPGERTNLKMVFNLAKQRALYRVFNNESFENGGRFYGGWWQQIKSDYRKYITINWHPVSEIDYSSMQPAILYAMEGLDAPADSYEIEGVPSEYRDLLKKTFLQVINAQTNRMRAPRREELPPGMTFADLKEALRAKHEPIARHFNSGIGIAIQRVDSDIAETVMLTMMDHGQLALPVHDSFIVRSGNEALLQEVMAKACSTHVKRTIHTKTDPIWHDEITTQDDWELHNLGVRDISENYSELISQPSYSRFRQRRDDFLAYKGEAWAHTRAWFNG